MPLVFFTFGCDHRVQCPLDQGSVCHPAEELDTSYSCLLPSQLTSCAEFREQFSLKLFSSMYIFALRDLLSASDV